MREAGASAVAHLGAVHREDPSGFVGGHGRENCDGPLGNTRMNVARRDDTRSIWGRGTYVAVQRFSAESAIGRA